MPNVYPQFPILIQEVGSSPSNDSAFLALCDEWLRLLVVTVCREFTRNMYRFTTWLHGADSKMMTEKIHVARYFPLNLDETTNALSRNLGQACVYSRIFWNMETICAHSFAG